jgi:hypothetical protein
MSDKLETQSIGAPGFKGLNTQDASADLPEGFALVASNCIIDKYGRIGSRKGVVVVEGSSNLEQIKYIDEVKGKVVIATDTAFYINGVSARAAVSGHATQGAVIAIGQNGPETLVMVSNKDVPLAFSGTSVAPLAITTYPTGLTAADFRPSIIMSGYGRLWVAGLNDKNVVYFSDTLNPLNWTTGSSGKLDLTTMVGEDVITGLVAHNNSLIVFLRNNILVYSNPGNPTNLALYDTINGLGCIAKKSIQRTGEDVIFLSRTGVRSLNRTVQEKSAPLNELSKNVRDELMTAVQDATEDNIVSVYSPENSFYLLSIPEAFITYCFDTRIPGQWRATTWTLTSSALKVTLQGELLLGGSNALLRYEGYTDNGNPYRLTYATSWISGGAPSVIKVLKKVSTTIIGGAGSTTFVKTAWDYQGRSENTYKVLIAKVSKALFGSALFGSAKYAKGASIGAYTTNAGGAGRVLQLIFETEVFGEAISIQSIGLYMKIGKSL